MYAKMAAEQRFQILLDLLPKINVINFKKQCKDYLKGRSDWERYLLTWYTEWSSNFNNFLLGKDISSTLSSTKDSIQNFIDENPDAAMSEIYIDFVDDPDGKDLLSQVYEEITWDIQNVINNAPTTTQPFLVVKTTHFQYPGLPRSETQLGVEVRQHLFNSTTLNVGYNLDDFLDLKAKCCYFILYIPAGNNVLYISDDIHAYPDQEEVLLPYECSFQFIDYTNKFPYRDEKKQEHYIKAWYGLYIPVPT